MFRAERFLRFLMQVIGTTSLLALPCALMPEAWMDAIHQRLGMGVLPDEPIVGYLARSTSCFYAVMGGLLWLTSFDLPRYRPIICYIGSVFVAVGLILCGTDFVEGMPWWWAIIETTANLTIGILILLLGRKIGKAA